MSSLLDRISNLEIVPKVIIFIVLTLISWTLVSYVIGFIPIIGTWWVKLLINLGITAFLTLKIFRREI